MMRILKFYTCILILLSIGVYPSFSQKQICITIDDLPVVSKQKTLSHYQYVTTRLVSTLTKNKIPAIGFINESKLYVDGLIDPQHEKLLLQWHQNGLQLGNHTFSHIDYHRISIEEFEKNIIEGEKFLNNLYANTPGYVKYFRHPYLHTGNSPEKKLSLGNVLKKHQYIEAPVTVDNSDWIFARAYDIALEKTDSSFCKRIGSEYVQYMMSKVKYYESLSQKLFNRQISQILLIHANTLNADYFEMLVKALNDYEYEFISLPNALIDTAYQSENNYSGNAGISWIQRWAITQKKGKDFYGDEPVTPQYILEYAGIESE